MMFVVALIFGFFFLTNVVTSRHTQRRIPPAPTSQFDSICSVGVQRAAVDARAGANEDVASVACLMTHEIRDRATFVSLMGK